MTVALNGYAAGFANGVLQRACALLLRSGRASHMKNFLLQDCAVQVVDAIAERDLAQRQAQAHPVRS